MLTISVFIGSNQKKTQAVGLSVALGTGSGVIAGVSVFSVARADLTEKKSKAACSAFTSGFRSGRLNLTMRYQNSKLLQVWLFYLKLVRAVMVKEELQKGISSFE